MNKTEIEKHYNEELPFLMNFDMLWEWIIKYFGPKNIDLEKSLGEKIRRVKIIKHSLQKRAWFDKQYGEIIEVCEFDDTSLNKYRGHSNPEAWYILAEDYSKAIAPPKIYKKGIRVIPKKYCEEIGMF